MFTNNLVVIGSSTGGLKILEEIFARLPALKASILIIQHITPIIDRAFVASLARISKMPVSLVSEGQALESGHVYVAQGGMHLNLVKNQTVRLFAGEKVNSVCPSIDVTMKSLVKPAGGRLAGVILTGMGCDGAEGIGHVKKIGGITIAQDQKSSIIYGMPKAAAETGMVDFILSTERIADKLRELYG
jgi:two-component system chemotaxis response regulator CheB